MTAEFDPYLVWLGIPVADQPPHHYRLLGLKAFEHDQRVINAACCDRMTFVELHEQGPHEAQAKKLLDELLAAGKCLLAPERKAVYDQRLKTTLLAPRPAVADPAPSAPLSVSQPGGKGRLPPAFAQGASTPPAFRPNSVRAAVQSHPYARFEGKPEELSPGARYAVIGTIVLMVLVSVVHVIWVMFDLPSVEQLAENARAARQPASSPDPAPAPSRESSRNADEQDGEAAGRKLGPRSRPKSAAPKREDEPLPRRIVADNEVARPEPTATPNRSGNAQRSPPGWTPIMGRDPAEEPPIDGFFWPQVPDLVARRLPSGHGPERMLSAFDGFVVLTAVRGCLEGDGEELRIRRENMGWTGWLRTKQDSFSADAMPIKLPMNGVRFQQRHWRTGEPAIDLIGADEGFCFLSGLGGRFLGLGEWVRIDVHNGRWRLWASGVQQITATVTIVKVPGWNGEISFREWHVGDPSLDLLGTTEGFCYIASTGGGFRGGGEGVAVHIDGHRWKLSGHSLEGSTFATAAVIRLPSVAEAQPVAEAQAEIPPPTAK
ncbi:MAG TPA: hypothetical protein VGE52_01290 [Pirellulales bacterium]